METLTIEELRQKKGQTEAVIQAALDAFYKETGIVVNEVRLIITTHRITGGRTIHASTKVSLTLDL